MLLLGSLRELAESHKSEVELKPRITALLNRLGFIPDDTELLAGLPEDWSLSSVLSFAEGALLSTANRTRCQLFRRAVASRALRILSDAARSPAHSRVQIDEQTNCAGCGAPIGSEDVACYVRLEEQLFHRRCLLKS
ncbi:unnamed protein product [Gongylonema pulchrum]|uniref:Vps39_2 domain-containing protein n=1 Tax=Gongylonema pulchrum TaxID=637853 RepID=A0A183DSG1_9BILA|nr:unnamed protein product [Gongylonema pulchrum]